MPGWQKGLRNASWEGGRRRGSIWKHQPVPSACEGSQSRGEAGAPEDQSGLLAAPCPCCLQRLETGRLRAGGQKRQKTCYFSVFSLYCLHFFKNQVYALLFQMNNGGDQGLQGTK